METRGIVFEQVVSRGCGLDVHKETVVATIKGDGIKEATKTFQTFTKKVRPAVATKEDKSLTQVFFTHKKKTRAEAMRETTHSLFVF